MTKMSTPALELVLHPLRLRIVNAMSGGRTFTTSELCDRMPDQSKASVYRHVALLLEGGLLEVEDEQQVRGAIERRYRLRPERAMIGAESAASMSLEDHRLGFTAAMGALLGEFNAYLEREGASPFEDSVSYRQFTLWLDDGELAELIGEISRALVSRSKHQPSPERTAYRASAILFPAEPR